MRENSKCILKNKETQEKLVDVPWVKAFTGHAEEFIDDTSCPRVAKPDLVCSVGSNRFIPLFIL